MFTSKRPVFGDSQLKMLRNIVSVLAMVMVLLLGALPVQADHVHAAVFPASDVASELDHLDASDVGDRHGDAAIHCGAPILGPEPVGIPCSLTVGAVVYFAGHMPRPLAVAAQELRPPRY
jgi:hypothetical protein